MQQQDSKARLYEAVILGEDADKFWKSGLGQWLINQSLEESEKYTAQLKFCDASNTGIVRDLQLKIQAAEKALIWIAEAIKRGEQALALLEKQHEMEQISDT